jgi:hypothetical protein
MAFELVDAKRRSHPLRYERPFSPKTSPVTEGLKFTIIAVVPQILSNDLEKSFYYAVLKFVIRLSVICKNESPQRAPMAVLIAQRCHIRCL